MLSPDTNGFKASDLTFADVSIVILPLVYATKTISLPVKLLDKPLTPNFEINSSLPDFVSL